MTPGLVPAVVFGTGGAVMVVELMGVRLIAPVYGTGTHVWAALISVALVALAAGYFAGGRMADRLPRPAPFFLLVTLSGLAVAAIPLFAPALIPVFEPLGYRLGGLCAAAVTFLAPLFLLGCATPWAVRVSAGSLPEVGRTAGRLYAVSTLGSVAGTLLAGFLLAPLFEIDTVLRLVGAAVALGGAAGLLLGGRPGRAVAGAAGVALLAAAPALPGPGPDGVPVFSGHSRVQRVEVFDRGGERWLVLDGCVHTHMRVDDPAAGAEWGYIPLFSLLPAFRPEAESLLLLGLGGGALLPLLDPEDYDVTVVEIDPVVVDVAREYFGTLTGREEVHVEDARTFVRRGGRTFDLVALDVCGSDRIPPHLTTVEFFRELRGVLAPGGVVAMNAIGPVEGRALRSMRRTLATVFPTVEAFATRPEGPLTNVIFFASDGPLTPLFSFEDLADRTRIALPGGEILTDQRNPVNFWNAPWARTIRATRKERY